MGVGMTPSERLDVTGNVRFSQFSGGKQFLINLGQSGVGGHRSAYIYGDATNMAIYNQENGHLSFGANNSERMRVSSSGDVMIGVANPIDTAVGSADGASFYDGGTSLRISGNGNTLLHLRRRNSNGTVVSFRRDTTSVGDISVTTTATAYNSGSDYRLKQNIEPMSGGLAKLGQLKPSTFEFIAEPGVKVDGFIAHEVQEVVPQAVTGVKDGEEMQGLDMSKLVPILVASIQELSAKVAALEARLA
jgi:hypothetical protein